MQFSSLFRVRAAAFTGLLAIGAVVVTGSALAQDTLLAPAVAARTISLSETGHMHAASHGGSTIAEQGTATGTYTCSITVHLVIVSAEKLTATFTVRPHGGTVSGSGSASFSVQGGNGYIGGTLAITKGTGIFAHASGRDIGFSGKFNRETYSATIHVHGTVHV